MLKIQITGPAATMRGIPVPERGTSKKFRGVTVERIDNILNGKKGTVLVSGNIGNKVLDGLLMFPPGFVRIIGIE